MNVSESSSTGRKTDNTARGVFILKMLVPIIAEDDWIGSGGGNGTASWDYESWKTQLAY